MDSYYKSIVIKDSNLYKNLMKIRSIQNYDEIYALILTGDPVKFIDILFTSNEPISIRNFYYFITGKSHQLIYGRYQSCMDRCMTCRDCILKPVCKISSTYGYKCHKHFNHIACYASFYSETLGKLYFENLYHHYYIFNHCELLKDIKYYIGCILFL